MNNTTFDFEDIRPYNDNEVLPVMERLIQNQTFLGMLKYVFPDKDEELLRNLVLRLHSIADFQKNLSHPALRRIINSTTKNLTSEGLENISPDQHYLFISNHRDIILDSAILNVILFEGQHDTLETAIGNNLLSNEIIKILTKLNKNFVVIRNAPKKELYEHSRKLSAYIHYAVKEKSSSVWIAQREGRTKDGMDKTQPGLLKMLAMDCKSDLVSCFKSLKIVPVSISYEFDPCAFLKVPELKAVKREEKYDKKEGEDYKSILTGITGYKGRVHLSIGNLLDEQLDHLESIINVNEKLKELALIIDRQILSNYKLWPSNFIAADLLSSSTDFADQYTSEDVEKFNGYMAEQLEKIPGRDDLDRELLLHMYANPVFNCLPVQAH